MKKRTKALELLTPKNKIHSPKIHLNMSLALKYLITIALTVILSILTLGCNSETNSSIDKIQITGSIVYQAIQVDHKVEASSTAQLTGITPSDAANSDYLYSAEPSLPDGITLNPTNGTITVANSIPGGFSNTYLITATVAGDDPQYKGSVTGSLSIKVNPSIDKTQITGSIVYQAIQVDHKVEASSTAQLTGITPSDAANSDYLYSAEPSLPDGITLNPTNGTITVANSIPGGFSNTYLITATVAGDDPQYKGSVTGSLSIKVNHFSGRYAHKLVVFKDELYLIGGDNKEHVIYNDVWKTSDGVTWTEVTNQAPFPARRHSAVVEFNNEIYLIGGHVGGAKIKLNDVWKSSDGAAWTEVTNQAQFSARSGHNVTEFKNELYLTGGFDDTLKVQGDVWKSSDGATWTDVTPAQPFPKRYSHSGVVFKNVLYIIGGYYSESSDSGSSDSGSSDSGSNVSGTKNDVWKSSDGINWTEVTTTQSKFPERDYHSGVVFKNELYIIGGQDSGSGRFNDVWKSSDGIDWIELTTTQPKFSERYGHSAAVFNNELYIIGGDVDASVGGITYNNRINDVWKSSNGIDWEQKL